MCAVLVAVTALGCAQDGESSITGAGVGAAMEFTSSVVADVLATTDFAVSDSCGWSFAMRDRDGTFRLTVSVPRDFDEGSAPGLYDLGEPGWAGRLQVGSGLVVWPCHDIDSDFDVEHVREVWRLVGGSIEILDPIGMYEPVRARIHEIVLEAPDGFQTVLQDIELVNGSWGWSGA